MREQTTSSKPIQFTVEITKLDADQSIGLRMNPYDNDSFEVTEIVEDGLVDRWNRQKDNESVFVVQVGDRVIAANDYTGKDEIGCVIRSGLDLRLTILRCQAMKRMPMPGIGGVGGAMPPMDADSLSQMGKMFEDPNMMKQMADMMAVIPPEQLETMMETSKNMLGAQGGAPNGGAPMTGPAGMDPDAMKQMMNNPQMMKAAEEMMANMSPETLASIAKASGMKLDDKNAKMIARYTPFFKYVMKCMFCCNRARKGVSGKGRYIAASLAVFFGLAYQSGYLG